MRTGPAPLFSIIIPARNEESVIGLCFAAIGNLDFPRDDFEVIVVDNGSVDRTAEAAGSWADRLCVKVIAKPPGTISSLRNHGASHASGTHLAFLDADCLPPTGWLRDALAIFQAGDNGIVGGFYANPPDASWVAEVWYGEEVERKNGDVSYVPSGNLMIRRDRLLSIGGFDETLVTNEDYELCQRALATGLFVRCYRCLAIIHLGVPGSILQFYRKQRWHGTHVLRVFLRELPRLRNLNSVAFAVYMLICLAGTTAGLVFAVVAGRWELLALAMAGLTTAPLALASAKLLSTRRIDQLLPFAILFFFFGIARAICLLDTKPMRIARKRMQTAATT